MSDKDRKAAFVKIAEAAKKAKGPFSMTNAGLDDTFVRIFVEGTLQPGAAPHLTEVNLESNSISNPGFAMLAEAVAKMPTLTSIKLRHQRTAPSVSNQDLFLKAMELNPSIIKMSVEMNRERSAKRDKLESQNRDLKRKARLKARAATRSES
mmetsp:Transcript_14097/g.23021  ORF Transcript_14097/g.23021 Transcript_14097/m.23021 type:complete len:152 (+) Transcript_14097:171-626(+)